MIKALLSRVFGRFQTKLEIGSEAANALVLTQIAAQGDDGLEDRHVKHTTYPMRDVAADDRSQVVDLFTQIGLDASETVYRNGVLGEHYAAVATPEFNTLTNSLRDTLAEMGWEYDGWECAVLKEKKKGS